MCERPAENVMHVLRNIPECKGSRKLRREALQAIRSRRKKKEVLCAAETKQDLVLAIHTMAMEVR